MRASIALRGGLPNVEATIRSSNCAGLHVEDDYSYSIARRDVDSIHHPGLAVGIIGVPLAAGGVASTVSSMVVFAQAGEARGVFGELGAVLFGVFLLVPGLGGTIGGSVMMHKGFGVWTASRNKAEAFEDANPAKCERRAEELAPVRSFDN